MSMRWCLDADIHVSYFHLAQIIPVNENLIVFPPAIWILDRVEICPLTVTMFGHFDINGLV